LRRDRIQKLEGGFWRGGGVWEGSRGSGGIQ